MVKREHLAVATNGTMFTSNSIGRLRLPGDLAKGVETAVADGVVSHVWEHTYLLWFDADLTPAFAASKTADARRARASEMGYRRPGGMACTDGQGLARKRS